MKNENKKNKKRKGKKTYYKMTIGEHFLKAFKSAIVSGMEGYLTYKVAVCPLVVP